MNPRPKCITYRCKRMAVPRDELREKLKSIVVEMRDGKANVEVAATKLLVVLLCFERCNPCARAILSGAMTELVVEPGALPVRTELPRPHPPESTIPVAVPKRRAAELAAGTAVAGAGDVDHD